VPAGSHFQHFSWEEIDKDLGADSWIVPRRSDTVRSWGYLEAYRQGYEYIMTLDDDVYPPLAEDGVVYKDGQAFVQTHLDALVGRNRWFNTLNDVKPRGIPFYNLGVKKNVVLNHGLWTNVLDYDAPTQLVQPKKEQFKFDNRLIPQGQYFPMCGMNLMFKREITVLLYHLLMGQMIPEHWTGVGNMVKLPFDRWGDIGCGIILKKICDVKGLSVSTGMPYGRHDRASNVFSNLKKEAAVLEVNEKLWEYVDAWNPASASQSLPEMYESMGRHMRMWGAFPEYREYFQELGEAMVIWANLFKK
jgi:reversibly glycosylated polypeptide / UDP-arabinopyranose mutase